MIPKLVVFGSNRDIRRYRYYNYRRSILRITFLQWIIHLTTAYSMDRENRWRKTIAEKGEGLSRYVKCSHYIDLN